MAQTYSALEGTVNIRGAPTASRSGTTNAVAIVGGYDSANADSSVTAGESTTITNPTNADSTFGDSEVSRLAKSVGANGVGTIYGVPVAETETTESISSGSSISLSNTPLFDPTVHPDHDITVTDTDTSTDLDVTIVYVDSPSASTSDTAKVNPINGEVDIDASGNYDITYTYGDYGPAITAAADENVRNIVVGTESPSVKSTLLTELADRATDFDFMRGFVGATPNIASGDISSYTPDEQDWRLVEVAPARGSGSDGAVRTTGAVAGFMAAQPIGPDGSGLYDSPNGLSELSKLYRPSEIDDFDGVTALDRTGRLATTDTTSTEGQFEKIYAVEIIDQVAKSLFDTATSYAGGPQDTNQLETLLRSQCQSFARGSPPDLGFGDGRDQNPYDVSVSLGADNSIADVGVTIIPYPVAETVNLDITVSDGFVQFNGAN